MRFLANENFPLSSVKLLRNAGHDVLSIAERSSGAKDWQVINLAHEEARIVLTFDRDYGELIYRYRSLKPAGIVYFRFLPLTPVEPAERLLHVIVCGKVVLQGRFTVIERGTTRQRALSVL